MGKLGKLEGRNRPGAVFEGVYTDGGGCGDEGDGEWETERSR